MPKRVTRNDVAKAAGVSPTTVSFVLNGRTEMSISEETAQRVRETAQAMGYAPNRAAMALRTGRANTVALWMSVLCPTYYSQIIDQTQRLAYSAGYDMMITDTAVVRDRDEHLRRLSQWTVDGILAFDSVKYVMEYQRRYAPISTPIVTMGADVAQHLDHVRMNLYPGAVQAAEHLVTAGCRRIAFVCDQYGVDPLEPRYRAYHDTLKSAGLEPCVIVLTGRTRQAAWSGFLEWLNSHACPDGLMAYNDEIAIGLHRALWDRGIRMPDDVCLVGHDGIVDVDFLEPRISTVVLPTDEMCQLAWQMLHERIEQPDQPVRGVELITRLRTSQSSNRNSTP